MGFTRLAHRPRNIFVWGGPNYLNELLFSVYTGVHENTVLFTIYSRFPKIDRIQYCIQYIQTVLTLYVSGW